MKSHTFLSDQCDIVNSFKFLKSAIEQEYM